MPAAQIDRRTVILGATAAIVTPLPAFAQLAFGLVKLRLLETTDIHVNVLAYDYYRDAADNTVGLAKTATLIEAARAGARNSLLFDNGDFLQGNPLGDLVALERGLKAGDVHPMIAAMNLLNYDGGTLGNHEFNYGLDFLDNTLGGARFPFVCANLARGTLGANPRADKTWLKPYRIIEREVLDEAGQKHMLRVGIIGFVPPQIMQWDDANLRGKVETRDIVETANAYIPEIREQGVDVVLALAHTGIGAGRDGSKEENAALSLSRVKGIDAIFSGHSHQVFPGQSYAKVEGANIEKGTLNGVPTVMAGFWGSHLGQIDLTLQKDGARFRVVESAVAALPIFRRDAGKVVPLVEAKPAFSEAIRPEHEATLAYVRKPVGRSTVRLDSYFSLVVDSAAMQLISDAQLWYVKAQFAGGPNASLPLLSAIAPFKAGGRAGAGSYTDVPAGEIALRNVADIYVFPNTLKVVKINGAQLQDWLERSSGIFNQIKPGDGEQKLISDGFPAFNFDIIDGVTYLIDVSQPSKFDGEGKLINANAKRILDLAFNGKFVGPDDVIAVVTNNYRASGGGNFAGNDGKTIIYDAPDYSRDIIAKYLAQAGTVSPKPDGNWKLAAVPGATNVIFESAPAAKELAAGIPGVSFLGESENGFVKFKIALGG